MTSNLIVLGVNAARINVKVDPNMTILKVLELACTKMKVDSNDYDLKYHNKILDSTSLIRFTNIANNALLELVPVTKSRLDSSVGIWLQIEDGTRLSGEFSSSQTLWEVVQTLLKENAGNYNSPAIVYTRMEIIGIEQLQQKTLKDIGLVSGKALLRLLNKRESEEQAHVYVPQERKPKIEESPEHSKQKSPANSVTIEHSVNEEPMDDDPMGDAEWDMDKMAAKPEPIHTINLDLKTTTKKKILSDEDLKNFKNSISYLDERDTLIFDIMDGTLVLYQDEGDDFFEPTVKDINLVLRDLKNSRAQFEDGILCTSAMREIENAQNLLNLLHKYYKCVIRIHFPNRLVLQSVFKSSETVSDIIHFVRKYLVDESLDFDLFTTPPKTILKLEDTLLECGCVPSAMIHFSCSSELDHLKPELKEKVVSACQASIAAYIVRKERIENYSNNGSLHDTQPGPSRTSDVQRQVASSSNQNKTENSGKTPKWFKPK